MSRSDNQEGFIDFNAARIHYTSAGQGKALVFVHAAIADSRMWRAQVEHFSQRYRVITFDMRGYGQTTMVAGEYNTATDLKAVMDGLGVEQAVVIGCSMGGAAVIDFALHHPARILALVPVCAGISGFEVEVDAQTLALLEQMDKVEKQRDFERFAELVVRYWIDGPRRKPEEVDPAVRAFVKEMLRTGFNTPAELGKYVSLKPPAADRLGEIHVPTLVLGGAEDAAEMAPYLQKLAGDIPGARLHVIEKAGHLPALERPAEFNRVLDDFLKDVH